MDSGRLPADVAPPARVDDVRRVARVTWAGLAVNVALGMLKLLAGIAGASQALVADAVHSLSDLSTDIAVLVGVRYWSRPADEGHPHGHRRVETMITAFIAVVLAGSAVGLTCRALVTIFERHAAPPGAIALVAACAAIVSKEALYRWTVAVGRRMRSSAVIANAWHHRSDSFSSIPVALAVGGAVLYPAWSFLDHVGAVVVSLFLVQAAWRIGFPALRQLVDSAAPRTAIQRIVAIAADTPQVSRVHAVRTRYLGAGLQVDLRVLVDGDLSVREGHAVSEEVKRRLVEQGPDVVDVVVHLEPAEKPEG